MKIDSLEILSCGHQADTPRIGCSVCKANRMIFFRYERAIQRGDVQVPSDACTFRGDDALGRTQCTTGCKKGTMITYYPCHNPKVEENTCTIRRSLEGRATCYGCTQRKLAPPLHPHEVRFLNHFDGAQQRISGMELPFPESANKRGIVTVGGGAKFEASLYVQAAMIRHSGCNLPIRVYYLGGEYNADFAKRMKEKFGDIEFINGSMLNQTLKGTPDHFESLGGWELKSLALMMAPFRHVVFLDADCYPVQNPEILFETEWYKKHGAGFWPDNAGGPGNLPPEMWSKFGLPEVQTRAFEAGQMVIDRKRCWKALWLAGWLNSHSKITYKISGIYGDKDTFQVAFRKMKKTWWMHDGYPVFRDIAFVHKDENRDPLFIHRCRDKFRSPQKRHKDFKYATPQNYEQNQYIQGMPGEDRAHRFHHEFLGTKPPALEVRDIVTPALEGRAQSTTRSLLLVGFPRGLTTEAYRICLEGAHELAPLAEAGEILNRTRSRHAIGHAHFETNQRAYKHYAALLDKFKTGFIIKDVVQPFIVCKYLKKNPGSYNVLFIDRDTEDVVARQKARGWDQPNPDTYRDKLKEVADEVVHYWDIVGGCDPIYDALERLGYSPERKDYRTPQFMNKFKSTELSLGRNLTERFAFFKG